MNLLLYGLVAIAVLGSVAGLVHMERKAGGDAVRAELQPKLTACQSLTATMGGQIKEQNAAVESLRSEGIRKEAIAAQALAKAEAKGKVWDADAKRLRDALTARKPDGPKDCKAAWETIRKPQ